MNDPFTLEELVARGWSRSTMEAECASGRLPAKRCGTTWSIRDADFCAWHDTEQGQFVSNGGIPASGRHQHHTSPAGSSGNAWQQMCERLVREGTPATVARAAADQAYPGGRTALVADANTAALAKHQRERTEALAKYAARQTRSR